MLLLAAVLFASDLSVSLQAPNRLDDDGAVRGCKSCRDGIADALGVNDRDSSRVEYVYRQERGGVREYGVRIEIVARSEWARRMAVRT